MRKFIKFLWRLLSDADTAFSWIGGSWKAGFVVMSGFISSLIAWMASLEPIIIITIGVVFAAAVAGIFHFLTSNKNKKTPSDSFVIDNSVSINSNNQRGGITAQHVNVGNTQRHLTKKLAETLLKATRDELDKLYLAVVTVRTKVLNHESFDACEDKLQKNMEYIRERESLFEGSIYRQEYRRFMNAAGIAYTEHKRYLNNEEREFVTGQMQESSEILENALR